MQAQTAISDLVVPEGFVVERAADSSLTSYPMFMEFDDVGNLFIAESTGKDMSGKDMAANPECQILRLQDEDGDGVFDSRTVFAENLSLPMGVLWHQGSLFVASPPDFIRFDDTDGDGVSDHREVLLTGWNVFNTASLHGPFLGPDGRLYLTHGRHGYDITSKEGVHYKGLAARIWRCWPDGTELERFAGGGFDNPVEIIFTDAGEMIGTMTYFTDPRHGKRDALLHFVGGGVYPKPHESIDEFIHTGPDLMPVMTEFSRIAPSGLSRYEGNAFGAEYTDDLFSAQFNPHRVQRHTLIRSGATFRTEDEDFLVSTNPDFFPTDVLEDADGSLLVSDTGAWYVDACPISRVARPNIKGAIYRVRKEDSAKTADPWGHSLNWNGLNGKELVSRLDDARPRVRKRALNEVVAVGTSIIPNLSDSFRAAANPRTRLLALTALRQLRSSEATPFFIVALNDAAEKVRLSAIQALADQDGSGITEALTARLVNGTPAEVREAATTLGQRGDASATKFLLDACSNPADRMVEHALIYALHQLGDEESLRNAVDSQRNENIRRSALISLDQLNPNALSPSDSNTLLRSEDSRSRDIALWIATGHKDWADDLLSFVKETMNDDGFVANKNPGIADVLTTYQESKSYRRFMNEMLLDTKTGTEAQGLVLATINAARFESLPDVWVSGIRTTLQSASDAIRWQTLDVIRSRNLNDFDTVLNEISEDENESTLFRLAALDARLRRDNSTNDSTRRFVLAQLESEQEAGSQQAAARLIGQMAWSLVEKQALAKRFLPDANALVMTSLLRSYEGESDAALGKTLVAALKANEQFEDFVNVGQLDATLQEFPADVLRDAQPLRDAISVGDEILRERFLHLEPQLGKGDVGRGRRIFFGEQAACSTCHAIGEDGGILGPDLTTIGEVRSGHDLLEAVMFPSSSFVPDFTPYQIETADDVFVGVIGHETGDSILLRTGVDEERYLSRDTITTMTASTVSVMPEGLDSGLSDQEVIDLITFLQSLDGNGFLEPAQH